MHLVGHILEMTFARNSNGYEITSQNYFSKLGALLKRELPSATRSSVCEARQKLNWRAFEYLLKQSNLKKEALPDSCLWKGHVVRAIDGSKLTLPHSEKICREFPQLKVSKDGQLSHYPLALLVTACNVLTGQPTAARIRTHCGSEHEAALSMICEDFETSDICLLDRGFDSIRLWKSIEEKGQFYICRLQQRGGSQVSQFIESGRKETILEMRRKDSSDRWTSHSMRLIRGRKLKDGSTLVVGTNLMDRRKYASQEVLDLYSERWNVETLYYRVKTLFEVQKFHARQVNGLLQEIFANLLILSMTAGLSVQASVASMLDTQKVLPNFKNASEVLKRNLFYCIGSFPLSRKKRRTQAQKMIREVTRVLCKRQRGRSYPRYSRQPVNRWPFAKAHKIRLFNEGRRYNEDQATRKKYKTLNN